MNRLWKQAGWMTAGLLLLGGCASVGTVDTDVTAFSKWTANPPGANTAYRFERLPSQQLPQDQQDAVETIARASLEQVGMVLSPAAARYLVQVNSTVQPLNAAGDGFGGLGGVSGAGVSVGAGVGSGGFSGGGIGLSFPLGGGRGALGLVQHDLMIVMRDVSTQQVVFETRALQRANTSDRLAVLPAMLDAALSGFPQPPLGTRRISSGPAR